MGTRLFFVSDIHASERCWRKFLAAPGFYQAQIIMVGGDITGKFVIPLIRGADGAHTARNFLGREHRAETNEELVRLKAQIADTGQYAFETTPEEYASYEGRQEQIDELFKRLAMERVRHWIDMAEDRLADSGVQCLVSAGNDDFYEVDQALAGSSVVENPDGRVVDLADGFELMGVGYGNPTPWNCPRDLPESELAGRIDEVAEKVRRPDRAMFSLHVPPFGSGLDFAPRLDDQLRMVMSASGPEMIPVGSTAVRDAILRYRPMLGLHGHIHESRGVRTLGSTTIVNPGSEYGEGVLDGVLIDLDPKKGVVNVQLTSG